MKMMRMAVTVIAILVGLNVPSSADEATEIVFGVPKQPLVAATRRLETAMELIGDPLPPSISARLAAAYDNPSAAEATKQIQQILDPLCLTTVHINPESRVEVSRGAADADLIQWGWRTFLVKVHNEAGVTAALSVSSPQAAPMNVRGSNAPRPEVRITTADVENRWMDVAIPDRQPLLERLSGLALEYVPIQISSRDVGEREATLTFDVGQGTQDLGFRNEVPILFHAAAAQEVQLSIKDEDGGPTMASFEIRDAQNRVYPNPARRTAPDFFFHPQIYRRDGESIQLPPGDYRIHVRRGPEYLPQNLELSIGDDPQDKPRLQVQLERWIDPTDAGWYSGDHHVHAAGCAHYDNPVAGVLPEDMMRHILGEDLKVGCVLSWGPCWYTQKKFFEGDVSALSTGKHLMRYDVEVSGFPSSHAGHLCLLRLREDDYPGTTEIEQWPSWTVPVLRWGKEQGGITGYSHSGWGLALPDYLPDGRRSKLPPYGRQFQQPDGGHAADRLPDYAMPRFDGIGANEYIVAVTHDVCDFISAVDTPVIWELNIWYHTLNCGFRTRISGETDFPCIYGERVGLGRVYVQLPEQQPLEFDRWAEGIRRGQSYVGDGASHVLDFQVRDVTNPGGDSVALGAVGDDERISELRIDRPGRVEVTATVAAYLEPEQSEEGRRIAESRLDSKPYWHIERSRIDGTRTVPVELVVNGAVVKRTAIVADASRHELKWNVEIPQSAWVAVRIMPSVHTNPIWVSVGDQPLRADAKSAQWCREAVDVCWESKRSQIREEERASAEAAYNHARKTYDKILAESP